MRQKKNMIKRHLTGWGMVLVLLGSAWPAGAAYVELQGGRKIEGTVIRATATGDIILTTAQGNMTFTKGQYLRAVADKPAEIDEAVRLLQGKQYEEAVKKLEDVISRFRYLDWDNQARTLLPRVYMEKGDAATAVSSYDKLFAASPQSRENSEVMWGYRQALLSAKQYDKLEAQLNVAISSGARGDAARAQIMRGDIRLAQGQVEQAALDYLRTMVLFKSEADYQAEATFKAASTLEQLRDARAKELYREVVQKYPSSPYAGQARPKM